MDNMIMSRIKRCAETAIERPIEHMEGSTSLTDDLDMRSLQMVMFQVELEDEFGIGFDPVEDDFFEIFRTIGTVYSAVEKKYDDR